MANQSREADLFQQNDQGKSFLIPKLPYSWLRPLGKTITPSLSISWERTDTAFIDRLAHAAFTGKELCIGYPLAKVQSQRGGVTWTPIGMIPVTVSEIDSENKVLHIKPRFDECSVNQRWVEWQVPVEQRRPFLHRLHRHASEQYQGLLDLPLALSEFESEFSLPPGYLAPDRLASDFSTASVSGSILNMAVLFLSEVSPYSFNLRRELRMIGEASDQDLDRTALAYVFRKEPFPSLPSSERLLPYPFIACNQEQRQALDHALNYPVTKITGPPGTGKSQVAVNVIANLAYRHRSVLFTSRNHKAVQAIKDRSSMFLQGRKNLPLVYFCSDGQGKNVDSWLAHDLSVDIAKAMEFKNSCDVTMIERVNIASREWFECNLLLKGRELLLQQLHENQLASETYERALRSHLHMVSSTEEFIPERMELLQKLYTSIYSLPPLGMSLWHPWRSIYWKFCGRRHHEHSLKLVRCWFPELASRSATLVILRENLLEASENWQKLKTQLKEKERIESRIKALPDTSNTPRIMARILDELGQILVPALKCKRMNRMEAIKDNPSVLRYLNGILADLRDEYQKGGTGARRWRRTRKKEKNTLIQSATFSTFLEVYPAWAATLLSLQKSSPCLPAVFDTVMIDEASQCDVASIIPALFRAKHAVIIGDPMQFPPVLDLEPLRHDYLAQIRYQLSEEMEQKFGYLTHTAYSVLGENPVLLKEHFRCHEDIVEYCSRVYYGGELCPRTKLEQLANPTAGGIQLGVNWIDVLGRPDQEIQAVVQRIWYLQANGFKGSIGVIAPLRATISRLRYALRGVLSEDDVNTVNSFQGGERDVIFFVLGYSPFLTRGEHWYFEAAQNRYIYNVAVSRARASLVLVGDRTLCRGSISSDLQLLAELPFPKRKLAGEELFESVWEKKLYEALLQAGIQANTQYPLVGRRLDLAVLRGNIRIDIEVDGVRYHSNEMGDRNLDDVFRDIQVSGEGWLIQRFWVYQLRDDLAKCVQQIQALLVPPAGKQK